MRKDSQFLEGNFGLPRRTSSNANAKRPRPADKGEAWLKHSIEEMGTLEHFLPDLYAREAVRPTSN